MSKTLRELFVDRVRQSEFFRRMLEGQSRRRIMVITAGAGLGKSWLMRLLASEAAERGLPLAQVDFADGQAYDALALVRRCRDSLGPESFNALTAAINEATTARIALATPGAPVAGPINISVGDENVLNGSTLNISEVGSTIVRDNSFVVAISITLTDGGLYPPFSTNKYFPSRDTVLDIGNVSTSVCFPAGWIDHPFGSKTLPSGRGPV